LRWRALLVVVMRASAAFYIFFFAVDFFAFLSQSSSFYAPRTFFLKQMAKKRKSLNLNLESLAAKTLVKMRLQPAIKKLDNLAKSYIIARYS